MLQAPDVTPYDLHFQVFGFPVRISAWFWLGALFFGFSLARGLDRLFEDGSPGVLPLLLLWMACLLISIVIHELGHALAFRRFGIESSIVLYHFGGLAIPERSSDFRGRSASSLSPKEDLIVAFSGPLLQLISGLLVWGIVKISGHGLSFTGYYPMSLWPFDLIPGFTSGESIDRPILYCGACLLLVSEFLMGTFESDSGTTARWRSYLQRDCAVEQWSDVFVVSNQLDYSGRRCRLLVQQRRYLLGDDVCSVWIQQLPKNGTVWW